MGKITRRGSTAVAVAAAATLAFAPSALADGDGPNNLYRFEGEDRIGTSIDAAKSARGSWDDTVIIANREDFADALAAAPLAGALDAPVILEKSGEDAPSTQVAAYGQWLENVGKEFNHIILASGTTVFNADYVAAIKAEFPDVEVEQIAGDDRYETAGLLADASLEARDIDDGGINVFLADGRNFPDGLAAGAAAASNDGVLLLTKGSTGIDRYTRDTLKGAEEAGEINKIIAVGGPAAAGAEEGFGPYSVDFDEGDNAAHIGENRYETATIVADGYFSDDEGKSDAESFVLASGEDFPDAVVGGAFAANVDGPLLLTNQTHLTGFTRDYLENSGTWINGFMFGGPVALSEKVSDDVAGLEWTN